MIPTVWGCRIRICPSWKMISDHPTVLFLVRRLALYKASLSLFEICNTLKTIWCLSFTQRQRRGSNGVTAAREVRCNICHAVCCVESTYIPHSITYYILFIFRVGIHLVSRYSVSSDVVQSFSIRVRSSQEYCPGGTAAV